MSNEGKSTFENVNDLLDADLNDLADLAGFEVPPPGAYILSVTTTVKEVNGKNAVEADISVVETVELEDKSGETQPVPNGTKFSQLFMLGNEYGVGNLKKFLKPFSAHFGTTKIGELVNDKLKDCTFGATVKVRKDKEDPDKQYATLRNIVVS